MANLRETKFPLNMTLLRITIFNNYIYRLRIITVRAIT